MKKLGSKAVTTENLQDSDLSNIIEIEDTSILDQISGGALSTPVYGPQVPPPPPPPPPPPTPGGDWGPPLPNSPVWDPHP